MKIGIDLYRTIIGVDSRNPFLLLKPNKAVIERMHIMKTRGDQFIVVTSAPNRFSWFSRGLLVFHHVPFDNLFCVGEGRETNARKLKIIRENKIEIFVDNNDRILKFLKENFVIAVNTFEFFGKEPHSVR